MTTLSIGKRGSIPNLVALLLIGLAAQTVRGQICPGSYLTYIVRDEKGAAIDAKSKDLKYQAETGPDSRFKWEASEPDFVRGDNLNLPAGVKDQVGKISALQVLAWCVFKQPVKLQLSYKGKAMNLTFIMPTLREYDSRDFLVDSLPFREGTFEITLAASSDNRSRFYPALGWKRVSNK